MSKIPHDYRLSGQPSQHPCPLFTYTRAVPPLQQNNFKLKIRPDREAKINVTAKEPTKQIAQRRH